MTRYEMSSHYFDWICDIISDDNQPKRLSYRKLLKHLYNSEFIFTIGLDGNRAEDGIDLRYRFGHENEIESQAIATYIDIASCSMLEMMAALSIRCEEHIMSDPDVGNRTGCWFWEMIHSLGLSEMYDSKFDAKFTNDVLDKFSRRKYSKNGEGGLFTIPNCQHDLRTTEIWYQMMWYLNYITKH